MAHTLKDEVLLNIYSIEYLLKCSVIEYSNTTLKLSPKSGKVDMFQICDPIVLLSFNNYGQLETIPADVSEINRAQSQITLEISESEVNEERRVFERYPVSMAISVRKKHSSKRHHFLVKNISLYGMGAISQASLDVEELLDIDLITDRCMFYFSGKIIWKKELNQCFEYGLQFTVYDVATKYTYGEFLNRQKEDFMKLISKAR